MVEMLDEILALFSARRGHFKFESGHHGDLWLEIPLAYVDPNRLRPYASRLARMLDGHRVDAVCGPLVEGALLAQMVAEELRVEFYFAEQFARANANDLFPIGYRIPKALRAGLRGKHVAVVDDVINAGSAVRGAVEDLERCGCHLVAIGALLTLGRPATIFAAEKNVALETLAHIEENRLWEPASCPLCASRIVLDNP
jgi:orotate phosphoribosyltransferase